MRSVAGLGLLAALVTITGKFMTEAKKKQKESLISPGLKRPRLYG
jgi:hypothetical protein